MDASSYLVPDAMTHEQRAKRIDDYAWGAKRDPHNYLRKLDRPELRLYEQAKYDGFVTWREGRTAHTLLYRHWCMERNIPQIDVRLGVRFATITYDADPTGYPYSCNVPEEVWSKFQDLFISHWVPEDSKVSGGDHHVFAYGVPNSVAPTIARQLWEWVKPFCISPEARDKSLLEAWTTSN